MSLEFFFGFLDFVLFWRGLRALIRQFSFFLANPRPSLLVFLNDSLNYFLRLWLILEMA